MPKHSRPRSALFPASFPVPQQSSGYTGVLLDWSSLQQLDDPLSSLTSSRNQALVQSTTVQHLRPLLRRQPPATALSFSIINRSEGFVDLSSLRLPRFLQIPTLISASTVQPKQSKQQPATSEPVPIQHKSRTVNQQVSRSSTQGQRIIGYLKTGFSAGRCRL